jgi:hypothetical protein
VRGLEEAVYRPASDIHSRQPFREVEGKMGWEAVVITGCHYLSNSV